MLACAVGAYDLKLKEVEKIEDETARKAAAKNELLPLRINVVKCMREVHRQLFAFINTYGELGNLTNWQQHLTDHLLDKPAGKLRELLGEELPPEASPDKTPVYCDRIIVPEQRTTLDKGEDFELPVILTAQPTEGATSAKTATFYYRLTGSKKAFKSVPLQHIARSVYKAHIPAAQIKGDFEYYIEYSPRTGVTMHYPATAPEINSTIVIY